MREFESDPVFSIQLSGPGQGRKILVRALYRAACIKQLARRPVSVRLGAGCSFSPRTSEAHMLHLHLGATY